MSTQLTGTTTVFSDDWSGTGSSKTPLDSTKWDFVHWTQNNNASYLGKTQLLQSLPNAYNGAAHFTLDTWISGNSPAGPNSFSGSAAVSIPQFNVQNGGLAFEGKFKLDAPSGTIQGGMIAGFFTYQYFAPGQGQVAHDEIDYEILTTETKKASTNVFTASSGNDFPTSYPVPPSAPLANPFVDWHTYRIEWLPQQINWYFDGQLVRSETVNLPNPSTNETLNIDLWGVPGDWGKNKGDPDGPPVGDPSFVPAPTQAQNVTYDFQVQSVKVEQLSTFTGDSLPNTLGGGAANDAISGMAGDDVLSGNAGDDRLFGGSGSDRIDGGAGNDLAVVLQYAKNVAVRATAGSSTVTIQDKVGTEGTDTLTNIETIQLHDRMVDVSVIIKAASLPAAQILKIVDLYTAGLGRAPDALGLDYWASRLADGASLATISKQFFSAAEATAIYSVPSTDQAFVNVAFNTVLGHAPDAAGAAYWVAQLQAGGLVRSDFVTALIAGASGADAQYIANREAVGAHFALTQGLNNVAWAKAVESGVNATAASVTSADAQTDAFAATAAAPGTSELVVQIVGLVP